MQQALRGLGRAMPGAKSWLLMLGVGTPDLARSRPSPGGGDCWTGCPMRGGASRVSAGQVREPREPQGRCWWWWSGWGQTWDTRHTWAMVTDGRVPETLGRSHPSAHKDATTLGK